MLKDEDICIHCGLCLPTCPTYQLTGEEKHSPRGRIQTMRSIADGKLELAGGFEESIGFCLGCLACETACPAGVDYSRLFEAARSAVDDDAERRGTLPRFKRPLLRGLFKSRKRLGAVVWVSDIRPAVKEQVESLGGKFIDLPMEESGEGKGGYAKEMSKEFLEKQQAIITEHVATADVFDFADRPTEPRLHARDAARARAQGADTAVIDDDDHLGVRREPDRAGRTGGHERNRSVGLDPQARHDQRAVRGGDDTELACHGFCHQRAETSLTPT